MLDQSELLDREDDGSLEIGPHEGFGGPQPTMILSRRLVLMKCR